VVHSTLLRMVDLLKSEGITGLFTSLRTAGSLVDSTDQELSSLKDSWIKLVEVDANGERNRVLYVIKSRGMSHSNQVREYRMTDGGLELINAYIGPEGVLTAPPVSARRLANRQPASVGDRKLTSAGARAHAGGPRSSARSLSCRPALKSNARKRKRCCLKMKRTRLCWDLIVWQSPPDGRPPVERTRSAAGGGDLGRQY
jgi:hypothetical protein